MAAVLETLTFPICQRLGAPQHGTPTSRACKRCMLGRGWRSAVPYASAPRQAGSDPDDPGLMCKDFTIGGITGSDRSNF